MAGTVVDGLGQNDIVREGVFQCYLSLLSSTLWAGQRAVQLANMRWHHFFFHMTKEKDLSLDSFTLLISCSLWGKVLFCMITLSVSAKCF